MKELQEKYARVFLETLFYENAACHIALGDSFPECVKIMMVKKFLYL